MDRLLLVSYILLIPESGYLLTITYISLITRIQVFFFRNSYSRLEKRSPGHEILSRSWKGRLYRVSPVGTISPPPPPPPPPPPRHRQRRSRKRAPLLPFSQAFPLPQVRTGGPTFQSANAKKPPPSAPRPPHPPRTAAPRFRERCRCHL